MHRLTILEKIGLQGKDCKYPGSGEGVGGKPTAATWPWFVPMDELIKEDMRLQREAEERRAQESRERMDRFFSILERLVDE
ncbi:unnamed protein product [Boreogadus saida]